MWSYILTSPWSQGDIASAAVKEQLDREDTLLELVNTCRQKADIFTKALQPAKWPAAMELLGIAGDGYTILTSTNTGLKQSVETHNGYRCIGKIR